MNENEVLVAVSNTVKVIAVKIGAFEAFEAQTVTQLEEGKISDKDDHTYAKVQLSKSNDKIRLDISALSVWAIAHPKSKLLQDVATEQWLTTEESIKASEGFLLNPTATIARDTQGKYTIGNC